ncbi:ABC transporter ATP-binding protein [Paenibacillus crassostreae]|uniref:ABC transporter ATP-binding protein n=1 Tax=Paenibacillus crassostreae TaxID=1763538 RepID=A0A167GEG8_9BACL|nr:ABC transporter ATP-binding protein [Paenibacillus crassostreae]AOZ92725.1 ABC transporter ATP-binding protein [Paenibacillus crassostreae]OAB77497.1 ABC transporter ATP-binding protein [Paenibacillus crassostreae]
MNAIVELKNVTKSFGEKKAVDNVSLSIERGSIVAILGPNGAGKTTVLSMILGLMKPSQGTISVLGKHPKDTEVRNKIGAMLQEVSIMDGLKVRELITLIRSYYPEPLDMSQLTPLTGLNDADLNRLATKLSGGQKRKLGFALALAGNPDLIFLDEPTVGLDVTARRMFWDKVRELTTLGKTILFTTHYLPEAEDFADRVILFNEGIIIADGTPDEIKSTLTISSVSFKSDDPNLCDALLQLPQVTDVYEKEGRIYTVTEDTDSVLASIFEHKYAVKEIRIEQGRLDDAFEQLTLHPEFNVKEGAI